MELPPARLPGMDNEMNQTNKAGGTVFLASDHAGFPLKEAVKLYLQKLGLEVMDLGPENNAPANWAEFGARGAAAVAQDPVNRRAILICGSGIGMSIVANKFPRVRGALCHNAAAAAMSRHHNDANVLCMGARVISEKAAMDIVHTWLHTEFDGGRHQVRLDYLHDMVESRNFR